MVFGGDETIPDKVIETWRTHKNTYPRLTNATLEIKGGGADRAGLELSYMKEINSYNKEQLVTKDEEIEYLKSELAKTRSIVGKQIPFEDVSKELKINYPELAKITYANVVANNFTKLDTLTVFSVELPKEKDASDKLKKIENFLKLRLKDSLIKVEAAN